MSKNKYFKRTKKKLVGTTESIKEIMESDKYTHFMHKFDGTHVELIINDEVQFITRDGNDVSHLVPYLVDTINRWEHKIAYYGIYACELIHLERFFNEPKDAWNASRRVLGKKLYDDKLPEIDCIIYDIHSREYIDINMKSHILRTLAMPPLDKALSTVPCVRNIRGLKGFYVPKIYPTDMLKDKWSAHILGAKREGFVLVDAVAEVEWDKTFTKLKPLIDIDCVVMGYNLGTVGTKNEGKVGSLNVGVYREGILTNIGKIPHMTDEERAVWTNRMHQEFLGCLPTYVIEIECAEITVGGKARFPNYVRERTDGKKPEECTWAQLI